jgi:hypothetical protein
MPSFTLPLSENNFKIPQIKKKKKGCRAKSETHKKSTGQRYPQNPIIIYKG